MKKKLSIVLMACTLTSTALAVEVSTLTEPFQASGGLAVAPNGDVFVADYGITTINPNGDNVYRVNAAGEVSTYASGLNSASGNVIGPDGALYQSSYVGGKVIKVNSDGSLETYAEGDEILGPVGVEFNLQGDLFIANCNNNTIAKQSQGNLETFINSSLLSCPAGLAFDSDDNLYVTNYGNGHILKINPTGDVSILATTPGGQTKPGGSNAHITFGNNQLYLVSSATHQVFSLSLTGQLEVIAGSGVRGSADGEGLNAEFSLPNGIDISADGSTLYVNDSTIIGNDSQVAPNVVRKIELNNAPVEFKINAGLSGAWYERTTDGSGLFLDVIENRKQLLVGWYTWAEDSTNSLKIGTPTQRWITALGSYDLNQATLTMYLSDGGVFDQQTAVNTVVTGSMEISFNDCVSATVDYAFDEGPSGSMDLERVSPDQLCHLLDD